jgi:hypothetical protein
MYFFQQRTFKPFAPKRQAAVTIGKNRAGRDAYATIMLSVFLLE